MAVGLTRENLVWFYSVVYTIVTPERIPFLPSMLQSSYAVARGRQKIFLHPGYCLSTSRIADRLGKVI